ncbi:hypothetical protein LXL04_028521 [Taraxacum kok-saghyz]
MVSRVYNQGVAEVLRMKEILHKSGDESQSESVVCELLTNLESMELTVTSLETTMIGKTVSPLKKHESEKVRQMAAALVKAWRHTVDEWIMKQSNNVEQEALMTVNMNTETKMGGSEKPPKINNGGLVESSQKTEATTKSKVEENMKKLGGLEKAPKIGNGGLVQKTEATSTRKLQENMKELGGLEKAPKIGHGGVVDSTKLEQGFEKAKRKLQEGYAKVENMKKKRRIQVMELHEVTKQGLLPQMRRCMNPGKNQNRQMANRRLCRFH